MNRNGITKADQDRLINYGNSGNESGQGNRQPFNDFVNVPRSLDDELFIAAAWGLMVAGTILTTACRRMRRLVLGVTATFFGTWDTGQRMSVSATKQVSTYQSVQENQKQNQIFNAIGIAIHWTKLLGILTDWADSVKTSFRGEKNQKSRGRSAAQSPDNTRVPAL